MNPDEAPELGWPFVDILAAERRTTRDATVEACIRPYPVQHSVTVIEAATGEPIAWLQAQGSIPIPPKGTLFTLHGYPVTAMESVTDYTRTRDGVPLMKSRLIVAGPVLLDGPAKDDDDPGDFGAATSAPDPAPGATCSTGH